MKRIIRLYFIAVALACVASCQRFDEVPTPVHSDDSSVQGREVNAYLPLRVASLDSFDEGEVPLSVATRASSLTEDDEKAVNDVWVFQFGKQEVAGDDNSRLLVCPPFYINQAAVQDAIDKWAANGQTTTYPHIAIPLIESGSETHLVVSAANVNSKDFNWQMSSVAGQKNSYADLKKNVFLLDSESASHGGSNNNLLMSGSVLSVIKPDIVLDTAPNSNNNEAGVPMYRSLSRIQLNLSIAAGVNYKVLTVQLRNIPQSVDIFDNLIARDEHLFDDHTLTYPALPANLIDYDLIYNETNKADGLLSMGEEETYVWYASRNMRGQTKSSTKWDKNTFAPKGATYIEVTVVNEDNGNGLIYRIYPGKNDVNDHTVLGNYKYNVTLDIAGDDHEFQNDSRIEQYAYTRFDGNNNCFILNPPVAEGMGRRYFEIPVTQVNRYWRQMWPGYGGLGENILKDATEWQVDLLWQDHKNMVRHTDNASKTDTQVWLEKTEGMGGNDVFGISVPYGATPGNFVMALRRKVGGVVEDKVLWSWHLWVTDYNPYEHKNHFPGGQKFIYPVAGGQVERYGGAHWGFDTAGATASNNWNNYEYNFNTTAVLAKSFMMDRNLGALSNNYAGAYNARGILHYNFGRKDPFPTVSQTAATVPPTNITGYLYTVTGTPIKTTAASDFSVQRWNSNANYVSSKITMAAAVADPLMMIFNYGQWTSDIYTNSYAAGEDYIVWNDKKMPVVQNATNYTGKSIYDPCPPGWRVPIQIVWQDFRYSSTYGYAINLSGHGRGDGFGTLTNTNKELRYWPNIGNDQGEYPVEGVIKYPADGYRYSNLVSGDGRYWTAIMRGGSDSDSYNAYYMQFTSSALYNYSTNYDDNYKNRYYTYNSYGFSVRCITIDDNDNI